MAIGLASSNTAATAADPAASADLRAFVPRGSLQWLRDEPHLRHRCVEASLVFVDISGFTAMSERLARLGRVGAEEVTGSCWHHDRHQCAYE